MKKLLSFLFLLIAAFALGDEVVIYGQLQNYAGTLEVVSAQLIEVIHNN